MILLFYCWGPGYLCLRILAGSYNSVSLSIAPDSVFSDVTSGAGHGPRGGVCTVGTGFAPVSWPSDTYQRAMPVKWVECVLSC